MKTGSGGKSKTKEKPVLNTVATKRQERPPKVADTPTAESQIIPPKRTKPANFRKQPGTLSHKTRKAIALVVENGVDPKEAMILTGCTKTINPQRVSEFKAKVEKYSLQRPIMQKLAHQAIQDTLKGTEARYDAEKVFSNGERVKYQEVIVPSYTNKLAAAAMVFDRVDPLVRRSENLNVNVDCSPVDLSKYRNR